MSQDQQPRKIESDVLGSCLLRPQEANGDWLSLKKHMAATKIGIGDIVEMRTEAGFVYVQLSHRNREMGELLRVLPGIHPSRPRDLAALAASKEQFHAFFPLGAAIKEGLAAVVGNSEVPQNAREFPVFRAAGGLDLKTGRPLNWWLWDGRKEWFVGELSREQRALPPKVTMTYVTLVRRLQRGWTPEQDFVPRAQEPSPPHPADGAEELRHYLYFPTESIARRAAGELEREGLTVSVRTSPAGNEWLVQVAGPADSQGLERSRERLEALARSLGGQYDGWEMAVG